MAGELSNFQRPEPDWVAIVNQRIAAGLPVPEVTEGQRAPVDQSSPETHFLFWSQRWPWQEGLRPSEEAKRKVLRALWDHPDQIDEVFEALPVDEAALDAVAEILQGLTVEEDYEKARCRQVRAWLFRQGGRFREQVVEACRNVDWQRVVENRKPDASFDALLEREPAEAERILRELAEGVDPGRRLFAAGMLGRRGKLAEQAEWRRRLLAAVEDKRLEPALRELACSFLTERPWPGLDEWVLTRLDTDDWGNARWYLPVVEREPAAWIERLASLLDGKSKQVRAYAAEILLWLGDPEEKHAADALRPLLPWVDDPAKAADPELRPGIVCQLAQVDMPECVEPLLEMLPGETDSGCIGNAARILA